MTADEALSRAPDALYRRSLGNMLVRLPDGPLRILTGSASQVWDLLDAEPALGELAAELAGRYDAPADEIRADVAALLGALAADGLVLAVRATGSAVPGG